MMKKQSEFVNTADLDDCEQAILSLLKSDGRMSFVEIAGRVGVAEATVRRKVTRLLEDPGIGVHAVVRPMRSKEGIAAHVGLDVERNEITNVAKALCKYPFVEGVYVTTGPYDVVVMLTLPSTTALFEFLSEELLSVRGIKDSESYMIALAYKHAGQIYI